jgi:hypothetical protein
LDLGVGDFLTPGGGFTAGGDFTAGGLTRLRVAMPLARVR